MIEKLCPVFPSRDIARSADFWGRLGFTAVHADADYLLLKREMGEVHFRRDNALQPGRNEHAGFMRPSDVDAFANEVAALGLPGTGIPRFEPATDRPWGMRECLLVDPDGNRLIAAQEIPHG